MTVSLHETPACLFPGTGFPTRSAGRGAEGTAVNVALPPGHHRRRLAAGLPRRRARGAAGAPAAVLVTQHGCDSHEHDPLADLDLSLDGQRASYLALADLADGLCEGRWVSTGGGGYALLHVVPAGLDPPAGHRQRQPLAPETPTPEAWRDEIGPGARPR